jgi:hypothetical protein
MLSALIASLLARNKLPGEGMRCSNDNCSAFIDPLVDVVSASTGKTS